MKPSISSHGLTLLIGLPVLGLTLGLVGDFLVHWLWLRPVVTRARTKLGHVSFWISSLYAGGANRS